MQSTRLAVVAACLTLVTGLGAHATDPSDHVRVLFSSQFGFTEDRLPLVTIGLMEGQREIVLQGSDVHVLPLGDGGAEVRAQANEWRVTVVDGKPGRVVRHVVVERLSFSERAGVPQALETWRKRGFAPRTFEIGSLFGISGQVLDRRQILVAVAAKSAEHARTLADKLASEHKIQTGFYDELAEAPSGLLIARSPQGIEVRGQGVLWFAPAKRDERVTAKQVAYGYGTQKSQREDRQYFGKLYVAVDRNGTLALVNAVAEDSLLAGLVPAEMLPTAPPEALKAQAVAARTELLAKIGHRHFGDPYRLCATQHCQVYAGAGREHPRTNAAVKQTRGEVLFVDGTTDLVETFYSSTCGGYTEANENVWRELPANPTLRTQMDGPQQAFPGRGATLNPAEVASFLEQPPAAYCKKSKMYRWRVRKTPAELQEALAPLGLGALRDVTVLERGTSGRAKAVRLVGAHKETTVAGELRIRQLFGGLPSSLFVPTVLRAPSGGAVEAIEFSGGGFGHGVGMCQWGAMGMAEQNQTYRNILRHYYRGSAIRTLY